MNFERKVLDHGYLKVVAFMGDDELVVETARMSTLKGFLGWENDEKFLSFLYREQHSTPFESGELMVEVQAPIFVARQWMRSRTQSYNEQSARYVEMPDLFYTPAPSRMLKQAKKNKQASGYELLPWEQVEAFIQDMRHTQEDIEASYRMYLHEGLAREVARNNMPVSQYTRFRAKANLRNWLHFLNLRMKPNAQKEIRVYAEALAEFIRQQWPRTYALFEEYDLYGKRLSRTEYEEYLRLKEDACRNIQDTEGVSDVPHDPARP